MMKSHKVRFACLALVYAAQSASAFAQAQQTPENAQLFLQRLWSNGEMPRISVILRDDSVHPRPDYKWCQDKYGRGTPGKVVTNCGSYKVSELRTSIDSFDIAGLCSTRLTLSPNFNDIKLLAHSKIGENGGSLVSVLSERDELSGQFDQFVLPIDWSKVGSVRSSDNFGYKIVSISTNNYTLQLVYGADLAARVEYAATVLSDACDPTGGLGF